MTDQLAKSRAVGAPADDLSATKPLERQEVSIELTCSGSSEPVHRVSSGNSQLSREERGWGSQYWPPLKDDDGRRAFRRICDDLQVAVSELHHFQDCDRLPDECAGRMAEIQELLERLYHCAFGEGESLKSVVVELQAQLNNIDWSDRHVALLRDAVQCLRVRWIVNDQTVQDINALIEEHGLDRFRGSISDTDVLAEYRIQRVSVP